LFIHGTIPVVYAYCLAENGAVGPG
jgi:hypothetical protein